MQTESVKPFSKALRSPQPLDADSKDRLQILLDKLNGLYCDTSLIAS